MPPFLVLPFLVLPFLLLPLLVVLGGALYAATAPQPGGEEYRVYEAALAQLDSPAKPQLHVAIYHRTLSGNCDPHAQNPVLIKGCSLLWIKPQVPGDVRAMLRARWHHFSKGAWKSFVQRNQASVELHEPIATPWKHRLVGGAIPAVGDASAARPGKSDAAWQRPDMTIYLSRVGFNSKQTDAVVYVLVFSYLDGAAVSGDYLHFRAPKHDKGAKNWSLAGRFNYFSSGKHQVAAIDAQPGSGDLTPRLRLAAERKETERKVTERK